MFSQNKLESNKKLVHSAIKNLSTKAEVVSDKLVYGDLSVSLQNNCTSGYRSNKSSLFVLFYNSKNRYISKLSPLMVINVEGASGRFLMFHNQHSFTNGLTIVLSKNQFKHVRVSKKQAVTIQIAFSSDVYLAEDYNNVHVEPDFTTDESGKKVFAGLSFVPGFDVVEDKPVFTARPIGEKKEGEGLQEKSDGLFAGVDIGNDKREEYDRQDEEDTHEDCEHVASIRTSGSMFGGGSSLILLNQESTKKFRGELYHCKHCPECGESLTN